MASLKWLVVLLGVAASLLTLALPALAQGPDDFDYRAEGLGLLEMGASELLYVVAPNRTGILLGEANNLTLMGTVRCMTDDPACLDSGMDGQPFVLGITGFGVKMTDVMVGSEPAGYYYDVIVSSVKAGDREFGPMGMNGYGNLSCADEACRTLNIQMAACSAGGARQLGMMVNGVLWGEPGIDKLQSPGEYPFEWHSLDGTAYLTRQGSPNPVCDGRDFGALFADEYDPLSADLTARSADVMPLDLPEIEGRRVDRDIVLDTSSAGLRDNEIILNVKGYFFGQCGLEPQMRIWDDADIVAVMIYRDIPEGITCAGGLEPFSLLLPFIEQDNLSRGDDHFRVSINGQIVGIHDIHMNQGNTER